jgi:phosphomannomutase
MISAELRARVVAWIADDPDERDRAELTGLLAAAESDARGGSGARPGSGTRAGSGAAAELADRFGGRLEFGTAGLRGAVAAGPNRMNRAVVRAATAALAEWLPKHYPDGLPGTGGLAGTGRISGTGGGSGTGETEAGGLSGSTATTVAEAGVVIGCDARHRSDEFAAEAARVLAGAGIRVLLLPPRQPTPLLAFAVRWLGAAAGVMITASHNPRADNGYKLYLADGAQILQPSDAEIEAAILGLGPLSGVTVADPGSPLIIQLGDEVARAYLDAICAVSPAPPGAAWLRFVYTPLHGVAADLALRAFEQAGFTEPDVVETQRQPDPDFPTVSFPNPEEPGALDLALAQARRSAADLVIVNDPDGDRLAVAVPDPAAGTSGNGGWRTLTGDQVGALLGAYLLGWVPTRTGSGHSGSGGAGSRDSGSGGAGSGGAGSGGAGSDAHPPARAGSDGPGSGGWGSDGASWKSGGTSWGSGGADWGSGGADLGSGGSGWGSGGADSGSGGASWDTGSGTRTGWDEPTRDDRLVATTIVSSSLLSRIAAAAGASYAQTLTGFKWIVRAAESRPGTRFVFGYEEALGYAVTDVVRDKDGIGAALAILGLATRARAAGESLLDVYDALETAHGVHLTAQLTVPTRAPADVTARLRAAAPTFLGGLAVTSVADLSGGTRDLPSADVLRYQVGNDRVVIRPSGTEPKTKAYLEVVEPVAPGRLAEARQAAATRLDILREAVRHLLVG